MSFCTCPAVLGLKAKSSKLLSARLSVKIHPRRAFIFQYLVFISEFLSMVTLDQKKLLFCPWGQSVKIKQAGRVVPTTPSTLWSEESPGSCQTECPFTSTQFLMPQTPVSLLICQPVWHLLCKGWMGWSYWHLLWAKKEDGGPCCWA